MSNLNSLASTTAWNGLEKTISDVLKTHLYATTKEVAALSKNLLHELSLAKSDEDLRRLKRGVLELRNSYLKAETTVHFFTDALNTRTNEKISGLLRACDVLCMRSMNDLLIPLKRKSPLVITYLDKGIGASIMKAGLRLWDGKVSPVAAIKVTYHNLYRPTAIIHETGHQVAHILGWTEAVSNAFIKQLWDVDRKAASCFSLWTSEIVADVYAFVHTGYAGVAALHDVVSSDPQSVFHFNAKDPHPISYIRVLLNIEFCKLMFGFDGPWINLEMAFKDAYDINLVPFESVPLVKDCLKQLKKVAEICLLYKYPAFNNKAITEIIDPKRLRKEELNQLIKDGTELRLNSHAWVATHSIELLALSGYKIATQPDKIKLFSDIQENWMLKLGNVIELN